MLFILSIEVFFRVQCLNILVRCNPFFHVYINGNRIFFHKRDLLYTYQAWNSF